MYVEAKLEYEGVQIRFGGSLYGHLSNFRSKHSINEVQIRSGSILSKLTVYMGHESKVWRIQPIGDNK